MNVLQDLNNMVDFCSSKLLIEETQVTFILTFS